MTFDERTELDSILVRLEAAVRHARAANMDAHNRVAGADRVLKTKLKTIKDVMPTLDDFTVMHAI